MNTRSRGFIAVETIAMVLLVVLVLIVAASLASTSTKQTTKASASELETSESLHNKVSELQTRKKYELLNTESLFAEEYNGLPFNERLFMEAAAQYEGSGLHSSRFQGEVISVSTTPELKMTLKGLLESIRDKEVQYVYIGETLPKISVTYGSLSDIQPGQKINIDETNDMSKAYQESIVSVSISPIE
ncbi:hypothetical protein KBC70_01015 [Candidatus Woesebacteria bacterium]|nr:hypothetical protein [Candidatus Woesebacteria bacterium]